MKKYLNWFILMLLLLTAPGILAQTVKGERVEYGDLTETGTYKEYLSRDGTLIQVGDSIQIGNPSNFEKYAHITQNDAYLRAEHMNKRLKIKSIEVFGSKKRGYSVYCTFKGLGVPTVFVNYEDALQTQEIKLIGKELPLKQDGAAEVPVSGNP